MPEDVQVETRQDGNMLRFYVRPPGESALRESGLYINSTNTNHALLPPGLIESVKATVAANWRGLVGPGQR